ncbi:hypothetical protein [Allocoleopsis sp.]|uniref:hypothetical protein n=1 Tax=Allocoleopsis sp. TaxID=3088169 RepID=UPI002FD6A1C6
MRFQPKFKLNYKQAFRLSLLANALVLVIGLLLFVQFPGEAAVRVTRIGGAGKTVSHKLQMAKTDIVFVECNTGAEPKLGYLRNQLALTCP